MDLYEKPKISRIGDVEEITESKGNAGNGPPPFSECPGNSEGKNPNC